MKGSVIEQKMKYAAAFLSILLLLPYIISIFVNGADTLWEDQGGSFLVKVSVPDTGGADGRAEADGIAEVDWTEYLAGILAGAMPEDSRPEALKAQAVLIRTRLYREAEASGDKTLTESWETREELEQKWGGEHFGAYYKKFTDAVEQTDDTVLFYQNAFAWTPFHQSSAGKTRSAAEVMGTEEYPYIAVRECPADKEADDALWMSVFTFREIQEKCRDFLTAAADSEQAEKGYGFSDFEILSMDSAGYVKELRIGETVCTGDQFRDALGLPSSAFSLSESETETELRITTAGKGHGLGMSLWTAEQMAEEGNTYEEILAFFFEGTELKKDVPETEIFSQPE